MRLVRALALVLSAAAFCGADIVTLKDGRSIEGEILSDDGKVLKIKMKGGAMTIEHKDIQSIEKKLTAEQEYKERAKKLDAKSATAQLELGAWARGKGLEAEAIRHCLEAWKLDNTLKAVGPELEKLDYHLVDGEWQSPDEYYPSKGYIKLDSRWYHPLEHAWRLKLKEVDRLNGILNDRKEDASKGRGRASRIQGQISAEEAKLDKVERDIARAEQDAENAMKRVESARKKLESVKASAPDTSSSSNVADHKRRVEAAEKNVEKESKAVEAAREKASSYRSDMPSIRLRINELGMEKAEAERECEPLDQAVAEAQRDVDNARGEANLAKEEWERSRGK